MKFRTLFPLAMLSLVLSACLSLAEDITPPPDYIPPTPAPTLSALYPAAAPDVSNGAALYAEKCAPCHGPTGLGDGEQAAMLPVNVPVLAQPEIARRAAPSTWYSIVTQGNLQNYMPGFASLTDQQRWDVVAYAQSLSTSRAEVETGKAVYEANCALCHGQNGQSAPTANFSDLQWLSSRSLDDWAASVRGGIAPAMPAFEGQLADSEIYAALAYVRTFAYTAPLAASSADQSTATPAPAQGAESTPEAATPAEGDATPAAPVEPEEAPAATGGLVSGIVSSGAGGALPSDLKVVLHGFDHGADGNFAEALTLEADVDVNGFYQFENVEMPEGRAFYVSLDFEGIEYSSDAAFVQNGLTTFDLPITVYETSNDASLVEISQAHVLLDFSTPEKVTVIHFLVMDNPSDKTIVAAAEGEPVVAFNLPDGFENLQFEDGVMGGRFVPTSQGFGDTLSVVPGVGQYQLVFAYDLPYTPPAGLEGLFGGGSTAFSLPLTLAARSVTVLVPEGVTVSGANFADQGLQSMGGGASFQMYRAGSLAVGQNLDFSVTGSPSSAAITDESVNSNQNIVIGVGALGFVLIAAGGYLFWRDRRAQAESIGEEDEAFDDAGEDDALLDEDEILDAILALDDQYKAGNIAEAAYRERRAELKAKLRNL